MVIILPGSPQLLNNFLGKQYYNTFLAFYNILYFYNYLQDKKLSKDTMASIRKVKSAISSKQLINEPGSVITRGSVSVGVSKSTVNSLSKSSQQLPIYGLDGIVKTTQFDLPSNFKIGSHKDVKVEVS